jgi:energy-coupling factor transporter ATP-binding protein EcfA2
LVAKDASRIILMDKGQIVADGAPRDILPKDISLEIGVGIPKATQVYKRLQAKGFELSRVPLTGEELAMLVGEVTSP